MREAIPHKRVVRHRRPPPLPRLPNTKAQDGPDSARRPRPPQMQVCFSPAVGGRGRGRGAGRVTLPRVGPPQRNGSTAPEATVRNRSLFHVQPHAGEASRVQRRYEISPDVIGRRRSRAVRVDGQPLTATPPHRSPSAACSHWTSAWRVLSRDGQTRNQSSWKPRGFQRLGMIRKDCYYQILGSR